MGVGRVLIQFGKLGIAIFCGQHDHLAAQYSVKATEEYSYDIFEEIGLIYHEYVGEER